MRVKLLIWDFDGTLAFREGLWSSALAEVARSHIPGCMAVREDFVPHLQSGFPWHSPLLPHTHITTAEAWWQNLSPIIARALAVVTKVPEAEADLLVPRVRSAFLDPQSWCLFEDVVPCLRTLTRAGWKHVVLSNHVPELPALVEAVNLTPYIAQVFTSALVGFEKPHPQSYKAVLSAHPNARAVMVGDNFSVDVQGAQANGLSAILVRKHHVDATVFHESLVTLPSALAGA